MKTINKCDVCEYCQKMKSELHQLSHRKHLHVENHSPLGTKYTVLFIILYFLFPTTTNCNSSWLEDGCLTLLADSVRQSSPTDLQSQTLHTRVSCSLLLAPGWRPCMAESVALPLCHQLYPHLKRSKHTTTSAILTFLVVYSGIHTRNIAWEGTKSHFPRYLAGYWRSIFIIMRYYAYHVMETLLSVSATK